MQGYATDLRVGPLHNINIGKTERGHTHDMKIFKELLFNLGGFIAELPRDNTVREIADSGFQGGQKDNELTIFQTPRKRKMGRISRRRTGNIIWNSVRRGS